MSPSDSRFPLITPVSWLPAREVLGGESSDFTPWLQRPLNLEILGKALKLEDLTPVEAEHDVLGKRLDILASALDENGEQVAVCIENQYGMTDPDHLGRLIAYLAQHERGRAVWVVEQAHDAFVAAVRFLNRTSTDDAGYYLVRVLFTHGADGSYQVHFEVLAAPIAWEGSGRRPQPRLVNGTKLAYLESIHGAVRPTLLAAGFPSMNVHPRGSYLWIQWPPNLWFRRYGSRFDVRVTKERAIVAMYVENFDQREANLLGVEVLRDRYEEKLVKTLPAGSMVVWDTVGTGRRQAILVERAASGYDGGDPQSTASWVATTCTAILELLTSEPIHDLEQVVHDRLPNAEVDDSSTDFEVDDH